ncbi:MAG TPA: DNA repair exonuclease [Candidatus Nitrosotenuis sp.]|nr:DNA repair exonuclease [Candidatus Nitrosotenuis sp.]
MPRFAHFADVHLGFQKTQALKKIEKSVFESAISECIGRQVDFVIISGDLFHVNIPEMEVNVFAFEQLRRLKEAGIPAYVVYGSHDFSPVSKSIIDLLEAAGLIVKVTRQQESQNDSIKLGFLSDPKTGAKIVGLPGLKAGKDLTYYEQLDRSSLESEPGFKIFVFHGGLEETKTHATSETDFMPLSLLPKKFNYYAGGHIHAFVHQKYTDYPHVVYPGTLFAGYHSDLEENAKGQKRGFVLVDFSENVNKIEFIEVKNTQYEILEINAENRDAKSVNSELSQKVKSINPEGKIVIIKLEGQLSTGKTTDIETSLLREELINNSAIEVKISKNKLFSREYSITAAKGQNRDEIETNVFKENIGQLRLKQEELGGDKGVLLAKKLLKELEQPILANEKKSEYLARIKKNTMEILGLHLDDSQLN